MEGTDGEPDFFCIDGKYYFIDAAKESPKSRQSLCYDEEARVNRKKFPPSSSAWEEAKKNSLSLLTEELYLAIQEIEDFDTKSSVWLDTPADMRDKGGALFGDKRLAVPSFTIMGRIRIIKEEDIARISSWKYKVCSEYLC